MRIAMLTNNYKPFIGGVPISIERLSEGLRVLGHEVYIFAPTYENQEEEPYVIRYKSYNKKLKGEMTVPHLFDTDIEAYFETLAFDMIHVHHPMFVGWMGTYLGKKYDIPVAYTYHTRYEQYLHYMKPFAKWEKAFPESKMLECIKRQVLPAFLRNYTKHCNVVFAPTQMMQEVLTGMGVNEPIEILPTGLDAKFFEDEDDASTMIRRQYIGDKKHLFCSVSRLSKEKNIGFMIEGLVELKEKIGDTFRLLLIGDGPQKEELMGQVKVLGLESNISFIGNVPNHVIGDYYKACDLFLFASQSETQGIVLLEAMAARNPVVAIKASGVVDVVRNNENGYMTEEDPKVWANGIEKVLADEQHFEKMKDEAYQTACTYSSEQVAMKAAHCYQKAIMTHLSEQKYEVQHREEEGVYYV